MKLNSTVDYVMDFGYTPHPDWAWKITETYRRQLNPLWTMDVISHTRDITSEHFRCLNDELDPNETY